jgi:hypothetical protein
MWKDKLNLRRPEASKFGAEAAVSNQKVAGSFRTANPYINMMALVAFSFVAL